MEDYEVIKEVGRGAGGPVYMVKHITDGKISALKKLEINEQRKFKTREAVTREASILAKLNHPHIVLYHHSFFCDEEKYLCIVQDFCDGGTLEGKILQAEKSDEKFAEKQIMSWFIQMVMAVQYMHKHHVLHRDLKPQNVFLTNKGIVKLGDFGISKIMENTLDMARTCVGTPSYLSPELCSDEPYTSKSDIWALGCLLYEMCKLQQAFDAQSLAGLFYKIVLVKYEPLPDTYSEQLRQLVQSILVRDPEQRPSALSLLRTDLVRYHLGQFIEEKEFLQQQRSLKHSPANTQNSPGTQDVLETKRNKAKTLNGSLKLEERSNESCENERRCKSSLALSSGQLHPPRLSPVSTDVASPVSCNDSGPHDEYDSDFEKDEDTSDVDEEYRRIIQNEIPEDLAASSDSDSLPACEVAGDVDSASDSESDKYDDDFEDLSDDELDAVVSIAKQAQEQQDRVADDVIDHVTCDEPIEKRPGIEHFIMQQCMDDLGEEKFAEMKKLCQGDEDDDSLCMKHFVQDDHMETCYLMMELLVPVKSTELDKPPD